MRLFTPGLSNEKRLASLGELASMEFTTNFPTHLGHFVKKCVLDWHEVTLLLAFYAYLRHVEAYEVADALREKLNDLSLSRDARGPQFKKRDDGEIVDYWMEETMCMGEASGVGPKLFHIQHRRDPGSAFEYET